jgi:hydrogenase expression/formation protein HypD
MKYLDEFRDGATARSILQQIRTITTQPWTIMEVCGGQTHAIVKSGIDQLLPPEITLVHGPGCPVCVTPLEYIDKAISLATTPQTILTTFGDMLRVPGSTERVLSAQSKGADVRMVYSVLDAITLARENPDHEVIFFGIGFETTAPGNGMALLQAKNLGLQNFSMLACHVLVPPALRFLLESPACAVDGYLAAGHVCTIMGLDEYHSLCQKYQFPIVVTGLEPVDILDGILHTIQQLETNSAALENRYTRLVSEQGNPHAKKVLSQIFDVCDRLWRGIGSIPQSGLTIKDSFGQWNAEVKFDLSNITAQEPAECIAGLILQGIKKPSACPCFNTTCHPQSPLGATMVSGEGACAAYYKYSRFLSSAQ